MLTLEEAIKIKNVLEELDADSGEFGWGPSMNLAKKRQEEAIRIINNEIKQLKNKSL